MINSIDDNYIDLAYERGRKAAESAATWTELPAPPMTVERLIDMIEADEGDQWEYLPTRPDLSGEWSGSETSQSLADATCGRQACKDAPMLLDALCDAWERGVADAWLPACARELVRRSSLPARVS
jgi:hypothetical protein